MNKISKSAVGIAAVAVATLGVLTTSAASAAVPAAAAGASAPSNFVATDLVRFVNTPGSTLSPTHRVVKVQIAGQLGYPTDITAAKLRLVAYNSNGGSNGMRLVMWKGNTGEPGTPTVIQVGAIPASNPSGQSQGDTVPVNTDGTISVGLIGNVSGAFLLEASGYYTADGNTTAPAATDFTATTTMNDRVDSGKHGNWAVDQLTRQANLHEGATAPAANCGVDTGTCRFYTFDLHDSGTFVTIDGASSPEAGTPIACAVAGTIIGGESGEFFANTRPQLRVPAMTTGNATSTSDWMKQFFGPGTAFSTINENVWTWTYTENGATGELVEQWTNAKPGDTGDITGVNRCGTTQSAG